MAYEATLYIETSAPISMTCADGVGIEKGALLVLSDPFTAAAHTAAADGMIAGIAQSEKIASDGITKISVYRSGIFKVTASGAISVGEPCALSSAINKVKLVTTLFSGSRSIGLALETAADGETFLMELKPGAY